ncbi:MAG: glycosyltransferase [Actinomycetota bacterium]
MSPTEVTTVDVSIITSGHDVADARLHRISAGFLRAGLVVEVLGLGIADDAPEGVHVQVCPRPGLIGRMVLALRLPWQARGSVLFLLDPDALIAAWPAVRLRRSDRRRLVADVHEDYLALAQDRQWKLPGAALLAQLLIKAATAAARRSHLCVVADDHVPPLRAKRRLVVRNEPDHRMVPADTLPSEFPRAVYVGDVRRSRGLATMLDAVEAASSWMLDVIGPVANADQQWLVQRLEASPQLADRVRWHGRLPPSRAWKIAAGAWVGFCLLEPTPAFKDAVPSKLYEYLAMGIVPIVSDLPRQNELVRRAGSGVVVADAAAAAAALTGLADDPTAWLTFSSAGRTWAAQAGRGEGYDLLAAAVRELCAAPTERDLND